MPYNAMKLNPPTFEAPAEYSFFKTDNKDFLLSAFKKAENDNGNVIRGYQVNSDNLYVKVSIFGDKKIDSLVNLNEEIISSSSKANLVTLEKNVVTSFLVK